jgi:hypothetical protein
MVNDDGYYMVNDGYYIIWLVVDLPLWKMMEFVSWDDDIPIYEMENKSHVWNHQRDYNPQNIGLYNPQSSTRLYHHYNHQIFLIITITITINYRYIYHKP